MRINILLFKLLKRANLDWQISFLRHESQNAENRKSGQKGRSRVKGRQEPDVLVQIRAILVIASQRNELALAKSVGEKYLSPSLNPNFRVTHSRQIWIHIVFHPIPGTQKIMFKNTCILNILLFSTQWHFNIRTLSGTQSFSTQWNFNIKTLHLTRF